MSNIKTNSSELILVINNEVSEISHMSVWLDSHLQKFGLSPEELFKFDLSANEVIDNIISYGFPEGGEHQVTLRLTSDGIKFNLEFEDDGTPFNPLEAPEHVRPDNIDEAKIGGLGIFLTRHYMDECQYEYSDGKNILKITLNASPEE